MVAGGLDYWFEPQGPAGDSRDVDPDEFRIEEWRLERRLGVDHLRLPPDYRRPRRGRQIPNVALTVPFLRFPQWHFCWRCKSMSELPLSATGRQWCPYCQAEGKRALLAQVPFVSMCDAGHLQDFPWREWVHRSHSPDCTGRLSLIATGGSTLANQLVRCSCGKKRNLSGIVEASPDGSATTLSSTLASGEGDYLCRGVRPQHGSGLGEGCNRPLRGSLRSASNLYFGLVRSAIYVPRTEAGVPSELLAILKEPEPVDFIAAVHDTGRAIEGARVRRFSQRALRAYSDEEIERAAALIIEELEGAESTQPGEDEGHEEVFRWPEVKVLREPAGGPELTVVPVEPANYTGLIGELFSAVNLVERLRETRVLAGFNRVFPEQEADSAKRMGQLWADPPSRGQAWLPGYCVFGEGLFLELREDKLAQWEEQEVVQARVELLRSRFESARAQRQLQDRDLSARFLLIHELAHVLMNQLTFECGYSSAALRERLYVASAGERQSAAVLIYTAAGDAEGTMGGLVRMGKPGYFEEVLDRALLGARWCAADPVCMEIGTAHGQGPDSCNLAACHSCGLVPETACEEFNRFLDRGLLIGAPDEPNVGFFPFHGWST
jgi:hypothetical protein